jgi:hypothetical protein
MPRNAQAHMCRRESDLSYTNVNNVQYARISAYTNL